LLFTATWEKSGLSAIKKWYNKLDRISDYYNILVTVHPWIDKSIIEKIKKTKNVFFIEENDLSIYLLMSDIMIADTSSIIAEFNALNKPIITFKVDAKGRLTDEIVEILNKLTVRIDTFDDLVSILEAKDIYNVDADLSNKYNQIFFDFPLGNHGLKAAQVITNFLEKRTK
jgi:CDP-glycerol glycerophosphotransferase (TagB/SpsB family)